MITGTPFLKQCQARRFLGPNFSGVITPFECKIGIVLRSGTVTYETVAHTTAQGFGQSTCIGIGGAPISATHFIDAFSLFEKDVQTEDIGMIGEIGASAEEETQSLLSYMQENQLYSYIACVRAPASKRMGHTVGVLLLQVKLVLLKNIILHIDA